MEEACSPDTYTAWQWHGGRVTRQQAAACWSFFEARPTRSAPLASPKDVESEGLQGYIRKAKLSPEGMHVHFCLAGHRSCSEISQRPEEAAELVLCRDPHQSASQFRDHLC